MSMIFVIIIYWCPFLHLNLHYGFFLNVKTLSKLLDRRHKSLVVYDKELLLHGKHALVSYSSSRSSRVVRVEPFLGSERASAASE